MDSKWAITQESTNFAFLGARKTDFGIAELEDIESSGLQVIQVEKFGSCDSLGQWDQMLVVCRKVGPSRT